MNVKMYNTSGKEVGALELLDDVFGVEYNEALIHQVVVAQLANKRQGTKSTLTRSEVRGGGRKPYRQKGSGRARQGSIRSPQWVKGGVVFAPKPRDFSQKINKTMKMQAIKSAISFKATNNEMIVLDELKIKEAKTKEVAKILANLNLDKRVLLVLSGECADILRASQNIPNLQTIDVSLINVYDVVANAKCLITKEAALKLQEVYA